MISKIKCALGRINYRLYFALLVLGLAPTVYTTVRVFFLGQLPGEWAYSIAGQLSWVNLLYEILNEAIILPLFYFMGKVRGDRAEFSNRVRTGMLIALGLYGILAALVTAFAEPMLELMAADDSILAASAAYIRIESVANIFGILTQFALVALVTVDRSRYLYALTAARLVLCLAADTFLVSTLPVSLNLGVNGIGWSNILVNGLLLVLSIHLLDREGVRVFERKKLRFGWAGELAKVGGISGLESLVRNVAYMVMIARMVNVVGEQGTYWVANNFIWGWLLLPVLQIYGSSMTPTLKEGQFVVSIKGADFEQGDLVSFYIGNKLLVKRVIAGPGDWVDIDSQGNVFVNNELLDEPYIKEKAFGSCDLELPYQVPDSRYFLMGDDRSSSVDSRSTVIGCVGKEQIVGRIVLCIWPISDFGLIE
jgi:signal peptidase I